MPADRKYDSVNLLPFLSGEKAGAPHDRLFWRTSNAQWAAREGTVKLVRRSGTSDELYDLSSDIGESDDVAAGKPNVVKQLGSAVDAWNQELVSPAFPGLGARKQGKAKAKRKTSPNP